MYVDTIIYCILQDFQSFSVQKWNIYFVDTGQDSGQEWTQKQKDKHKNIRENSIQFIYIQIRTIFISPYINYARAYSEHSSFTTSPCQREYQIDQNNVLF